MDSIRTNTIVTAIQLFIIPMDTKTNEIIVVTRALDASAASGSLELPTMNMTINTPARIIMLKTSPVSVFPYFIRSVNELFPAGLKMDKNTHGVIQVLFLFAGMLFVILTASIVTESASFSGVGAVEAAANSGYALTIYIFWFVMFWFIVLLLYKVLVMIGVIKPLKWGV